MILRKKNFSGIQTNAKPNASARGCEPLYRKIQARVVCVKTYMEKMRARAKKIWHAVLSNFSTLRPSDENSRRRLLHMLSQHMMQQCSQMHCIFATPLHLLLGMDCFCQCIM